MDIGNIEAKIIDYIDGRLSDTEKAEVEQELMRNEKAFTMYEQLKEVMHAMDHAEKLEPSPNLKLRFNEALHAEIATSHGGKVVFFRSSF